MEWTCCMQNNAKIKGYNNSNNKDKICSLLILPAFTGTEVHYFWEDVLLRGCASEGCYWGWGRPCSGWGRPHNVWNKAITDTYTGLWACVCLQLSPWEPVLKQKATLTWFMAGLERSLKLCNAYGDRVDPDRKKNIQTNLECIQKDKL